METNKTIITIKTTVNAPVQKVWAVWSGPEHIVNWCSASPDWHTPHAENDLTTGGKFVSTMAAKDGSMSFDFGGTYTAVRPNEYIAYTMDDGRTAEITFTGNENETSIVESFEAENENPVEMQQGGWQAILDNFKEYVENC